MLHVVVFCAVVSVSYRSFLTCVFGSHFDCLPIAYATSIIYTDEQKKRYDRYLSGYTCGSQTQAARAYHDNNPE